MYWGTAQMYVSLGLWEDPSRCT